MYQHFGGCTGYGHDEGGGREALDNLFAEIVGAESAIVRSQVSIQLSQLLCHSHGDHIFRDFNTVLLSAVVFLWYSCHHLCTVCFLETRR